MAAGLLCLAEGYLSQTASINNECISRAEGELLVADAKILHLGPKLILLRSDVYVRSGNCENLVAIAQINMSRISDKSLRKNLKSERLLFDLSDDENCFFSATFADFCTET